MNMVKIAWLLFLLSPLAGYLRLRLLSSILGQAVFLRTISFLFFHFQSITLVFFILSFMYATLLKKEHGASEDLKRLLKFFLVSSSIGALVSGLLINLETVNYPNYIYSHIGVKFDQLIIFFAIAFIVTALSLWTLLVGGHKRQLLGRKRTVTELTAILGIIGLSILSLKTLVEFKSISKWALSGYETKLGNQYSYYGPLIKGTPENGKIILPPQTDIWATIGNQPVSRYFLYPRTLIGGEYLDEQSFATKVKEAYFIAVEEKPSYSWPQIDEKTKAISFDEGTFIKYRELRLFYKEDFYTVYRINF